MNKRNLPDVLKDAARCVGGKDKMRVIETPKADVKPPSSVPGHAKAVPKQHY